MPIAEILVWASLGFMVYIMILYPVAVSLIASYRAKPVRRAPFYPSVSIILATHNGARFLKEKLQSMRDLDYPREKMQVIVVDDGSTDESAQILAQHGEFAEIERIEKSGKAVALNHGLERARGEVVVFTDVRQTLAPDSLRQLTENFADPQIGCVSAELQIRSGELLVEENIGAYWKFERWLRLNLSAIDSIFGASGSYYAIRRELAKPIPPGTLLDDMYVPLNAFFRGYRVIVDARAKMYDYPTSLKSEFGRKVRTLAGNYQIIRAYPQLLGPRNRMWLHYMSYKFGRLLLPFALIVATVASIAAGGWIEHWGLYAQGFLYGGAIVDPIVPELSVLKILTSPTRTFVVMMLAALCAISIWFVPADRLWRKTEVRRTESAA